MEKFCVSIPKIELHAHLNGSLSRATLKDLGCLEEDVQIYNKSDIDLQTCFQLFSVAHKATSDVNSVKYVTKQVIKEFADDNVLYLELRTTPREEQNMTEEEYIEAVVDGITSHKSPIVVKLLLSLDRRRSIEEQRKTVKSIIKFKKLYPDIVKGIDLSGNPSFGEFYEDLFIEARYNGLFTAIHCAEIKNDIEAERILNFNPDRIGHGTFLHPESGGSQRLWQMNKMLQIPTEICLTSNVICRTTKSYKEHHIQAWIKDELPFSLCTDDKGVFNTSLSKEFFLAYQHLNLNREQLWKISRNSIDYSFASNREKQELRIKLKEWRQENMQ
ncbi:adenosine deaminase-like protein [Cylas formicarius]|uniref:adenosine deaminase-like protein n=1 Tax=Cylas formicarius TaxID=197179 RepID=UPI002958948D|nr:adenosine deaminase-like protein [Cylas formicarius]